jgi:misacylated tRNA(Ala) deacylase
VTELAYLPDLAAAYVRTFRSRVVALPPGAVVLERTYFYPTGGGQPADHGTLSTAAGGPLEVVDVTKSGLSVLHRVRGPVAALRALAPGADVEGAIDWSRRYRHMRLHTGQHLASARIFARTGLRTRKANLGGTSATLDLEGALPDGALAEVERDLAEAVARPRPVSIRSIPRAEWDANPYAGRSGLVPLPPQVDPVRVVEIDAADICPCGGTHLRSTEEIGRVEFRPVVPLPGGASRVVFSLADGLASTPP